MYRLLICLTLAGCASSTNTYGPNGEPQVFIDCNLAGLNACYQEAAKRCPRGYRTVQVVDTFTPGVLSSHSEKNITVACN